MATQTELKKERERFKELATDYIKSGMLNVDIKILLGKKFDFSSSKMDQILSKARKEVKQ